MESDYTKLIEEISSYLEKKYGEKFVVDRLVSDDGNPMRPNKAYVHPETCEYEWFAVRFDADETDGDSNEADAGESEGIVKYEFSDGYGFIFAERLILPEYDAWLEKAVPGAKLTLKIESGLEVTREIYGADAIIKDFIELEQPFVMSTKIFLMDCNLAERDRVFEALSIAFVKAPQREINNRCQIIFIRLDKYGMLNRHKYKEHDYFDFLGLTEVSALTRFFITKDANASDILEEMKKNLDDNPNKVIESITATMRDDLREAYGAEMLARLESVIEISTWEIKENACPDTLEELAKELAAISGGKQDD